MTEKYLLRQVAREWLPAEILARVKRPYRAPIHRSFFNDENSQYVRELLDPGAIRATGLFNPNAVSQLVAKVAPDRSVGEADSMALVGIISTQLLHRRFVQQFEAGRPVLDTDRVKVVNRTHAEIGNIA